MVMLMETGNGDDDNVCSMAAVMEMAMVTVMCYPTRKYNAVPATCDTLDKAHISIIAPTVGRWMVDG